MNKYTERFHLYFNQLVLTLPMHREGVAFIREHKPWKSMQNYTWTARALLVAAILLGIYLFKDTFLYAKMAVTEPDTFSAGITSFFSDFSFEKMNWAMDGTKKYLVLIVLELFTFHFIQRTLEIQIGRKPSYTFKAFYAAEKRMIKASIVAYIMETITRLVAVIILGLVGLDHLFGDAVGLLIQFYFLGFIIIDNYHELMGLSLKDSREKTKEVVGVALAIGAVTYLLMFIPFIGVVAATMIGAVTSTLAMERLAPVSPEEELV